MSPPPLALLGLGAPWHPLQQIPAGRRRRLLLGLMAGAAGMGVIMHPSGKKLSGAETPWGIVSLELALTPARARQILAAWSRAGVIDDAVTNVRLDDGLIFFYSNALALASVMVADASPSRRPGTWFAWGAWLAGACDAVENAAMLAMLDRPERAEGRWPAVATCCAVSKFALIGVTLAYVIGGAIRNAARART